MIAFVALHLWQSTLFLLVAWQLAKLFKRNAAVVRYWIWFIASTKFLVPFAALQWLGAFVGRSLPEPILLDSALLETGNAIFVPAVFSGVSTIDSDVSMLPRIVVAVWISGAALSFLRWFVQWRAVHTVVRDAPLLDLNMSAPVRLIDKNLTAGVFGVFRPSIILPRVVLEKLTANELHAVLAHESCHLRQRDNLTAAIHKCVEAVFWFHPLIWWIGTNLLREREAACDEFVIEEGHEQSVYAQSILNVCRLGLTHESANIAASTGGDLIERMSSIMNPERAVPVGTGRAALLIGTAMIACYGPIAAGVVTGALQESADLGPTSFESIALRQSQRATWRRAQFDRSGGRLQLKNASLRDLIALAYPASTVNSESGVIDRIHYDIDAQWQVHSGGSERRVYRDLLQNIVHNHSNLQIYVTDTCRQECS